ncbi:MAG: hypothetical protein EA397_08575 [Deltaproteobacteria bacterium]|nr:MAG: hypothetical protein EA397_08575 [Deltaproteobacteria bacterium]
MTPPLRAPRYVLLSLLVVGLLACGSEPESDASTDRPDLPSTDGPRFGIADQRVRVRLNEVPIEGAIVTQPGVGTQLITDEAGEVIIPVDFDTPFEVWVTAAHPEARTGGAHLRQPSDALLVLDLRRYHATDNSSYVFDDPGSPTRSSSVQTCSHCHQGMNEDWYGSSHAGSASNPALADLYLGTASYDSQSACEEVGGRWELGPAVGTTDEVAQCYLGPGVAHDLDPSCDEPPCGPSVSQRGGCADCHAPGIDGQLGGRDLLSARGVAFESGVHCDVCHKVASIHLDQPGGVGGALRIHRPLETGPIQEYGDYMPLHFGPRADVVSDRMGAVVRDHFVQGEFCGACHEQRTPPSLPDAELDDGRWPDGTLPLMTTYTEWRDSPGAPEATCQSCHMPADESSLNAADLQSDELGARATGWPRPAGSIRRHTFTGPRSPDAHQLPDVLQADISARLDDDRLIASVTVSNGGSGHAFPTGEALRNAVLRVAARCGDAALPAIGGLAIPDFGGAIAVRDSTEGFDHWPQARVGHSVRVVRDTGDFLDPVGFGPFGDGRFDAPEKGLRAYNVVGTANIVAVEDGSVTFDAPLPDGDLAYLVDEAAWPESGSAATTAAGGPGYAFARVTVGPTGARQVPGHRAVDIASDNRLLPGAAHTSEHTFALDGCAEPQVAAQVTWRPYPVALARQKGWENLEREVASTDWVGLSD